MVTSDSPELFESSSRFVKRKRTPVKDSRTSQMLPDTEPISTTTGGAPRSRSKTGCNESPARRRKRGDADSFSETHMVQQCNNQNVRRHAQTDHNPSRSNCHSTCCTTVRHSCSQRQFYRF